MDYRAIRNVDFTELNSNEYTRLKLALVETGWVSVETSAFSIETDCLPAIWRGIELVARQAESAGKLSALTFHVQGAIDGFEKSLKYISDTTPKNALAAILSKPMPAP